MTAPQQSDGIETTPPPAVSSLRSRFEKLAADSSAPAPSTLKPSTPLTPAPAPLTPSPRPVHAPELESNNHYLHPASSSSDLRSLAKRPPPPPPLRPTSRAPSPALNRSPLLLPSSPARIESDLPPESTPVPSKAAALARRPPPPPPLSQDHSTQRPMGISSLVKQFG
ncbi:hypothetical protein BD311DRAFT_757015 [Dichomitus squalens]|uniref:Uncharacterized protein n=1 Tax=Dichomitus squalens TaxID=114155 RepID=A0A4Q9MN60_9APHY|nr:hypothetical protein BD311DRAFT_757015 [Dichomitus squalens]